MPSKKGKSSTYDKEVITLDDEKPAEIESIGEESGEEGEIITLSDEKSDGELSGDDDVVELDEPSSSNVRTTKKASVEKSVETTKKIPVSDDDCEILVESSTEIVTTPQNITITSKRKKLKAKRAKAADDKGVIEEYGNFMVDRVETSMTIEDVGEEEPGEIVSAWRESFMKKLLTPVSNDTEPTPKTSRKRPSIQCWNCDGDHNLTACPEKRDHKKISEARKYFQEMKQKAENPERYHSEQADGTTSEGKYRPGRVSDALRNAMGLGRDDLPEYIYRMRNMGFVKGYPPGYLKQALKKDVDSETLTFFVDDPVSLAATKVTPKPKKEAKPAIVEEKKIHYYMGFNNTYKFMKDRENNFRIPPFEIFVEMLQKEQDRLFKEMKRREVFDETRKDNGKKVKQSLKTDNDDMDVTTDGEQDNGEECASDEARSIQSIDDMKDQSISDMFVIDKEPRVIPETSEGRPVLEAKQETSKVQKGDSSLIIPGTPVLQHRHSASGNMKQSSSMPDLSAFAKGVTPFLRTEEAYEKKGLFKKIFSSIKEKFKKESMNP